MTQDNRHCGESTSERIARERREAEPKEWHDAFLPRPWGAIQDEDDQWQVVCHGYDDETPVIFVGTAEWPLDELHAQIGAAGLDALVLLNEIGAQFRAYEALHRKKGTVDGDEKAKINASFADRCQRLVRATVGEDVRLRLIERYGAGDSSVEAAIARAEGRDRG